MFTFRWFNYWKIWHFCRCWHLAHKLIRCSQILRSHSMLSLICVQFDALQGIVPLNGTKSSRYPQNPTNEFEMQTANIIHSHQQRFSHHSDSNFPVPIPKSAFYDSHIAHFSFDIWLLLFIHWYHAMKMLLNGEECESPLKINYYYHKFGVPWLLVTTICHWRDICFYDLIFGYHCQHFTIEMASGCYCAATAATETSKRFSS